MTMPSRTPRSAVAAADDIQEGSWAVPPDLGKNVKERRPQ